MVVGFGAGVRPGQVTGCKPARLWVPWTFLLRGGWSNVWLKVLEENSEWTCKVLGVELREIRDRFVFQTAGFELYWLKTGTEKPSVTRQSTAGNVGEIQSWHVSTENDEDRENCASSTFRRLKTLMMIRNWDKKFKVRLFTWQQAEKQPAAWRGVSRTESHTKVESSWFGVFTKFNRVWLSERNFNN